ncbi:MAG TPA: hemagglutination [Cyanobacteria bacterium UBA11148]|nr:hemagglutination [Cyanobacteria bacterium UBA11148]
MQATTSIKTGTINSSGTSGNGGNVTLDPENDIEVNSINAQGGANGVGGNVDITTEQNFRATGTFTDQNGINASISTAGGQGGGPVTIRHGGGSQNTPFVVGDATTNGTAGAITTGENNTIAPVQSFPGSYTQGTPPNQIQIITQDQPNGGEIPNNSEVVEQPPAPPIQTEPQRPVDTIVDEIENYFTTQADKYVGGNTRIKTLDEIRNDLRQVEQATNGEIKPGVIYAFFSPRGPVVRPELDAEGFPRQPNIALEAPLQLVLVTSTGEVINKFIPNATRTNVFKEVANLRRDLDSQSQEGNEKYLKSAEQFYDWLIRPIEKDLEAQGVNNLVFVMDEKLGSVPLAAMRDRQDNQFIIQKGYSIGLTPSMSLINIRDANSRNVLKNAHVLAMGARDFKNLTPLPGAEVEIDFILDLWQGESFLNDQFTVENLKEAHNTGSYQIIHLATHAKFEQGERNNSFIQFGGGKLVELDEIPKLGLDNPSVELLVLSACNTALGNKDAELGFAGFARIAGVKSVVASLWSISDVRSLGLMTQFYTQLKTAPIKAEALRQAQLALLEGKVKIENGELVSDEYRIRLPGEDNNNQPLSHPYYWSGFTMIGNPW